MKQQKDKSKINVEKNNKKSERKKTMFPKASDDIKETNTNNLKESIIIKNKVRA